MHGASLRNVLWREIRFSEQKSSLNEMITLCIRHPLCSYLLPGYWLSKNSERVLGRKIPWLCMARTSATSCNSELVIVDIMYLSVRQQIHWISCKTSLKWCKQECIGLNSTLKHLEWCIETVGNTTSRHRGWFPDFTKLTSDTKSFILFYF